jgi:hypothetical protein
MPTSGSQPLTQAVALYDEWVGHVSDDGFIHAPGTTFYGMIELGDA